MHDKYVYVETPHRGEHKLGRITGIAWKGARGEPPVFAYISLGSCHIRKQHFQNARELPNSIGLILLMKLSLEYFLPEHLSN